MSTWSRLDASLAIHPRPWCRITSLGLVPPAQLALPHGNRVLVVGQGRVDEVHEIRGSLRYLGHGWGVRAGGVGQCLQAVAAERGQQVGRGLTVSRQTGAADQEPRSQSSGSESSKQAWAPVWGPAESKTRDSRGR